MAKATKNAEVKSLDQLASDLETKQTELSDARTNLAAGDLANPRVIRSLKKDIARLKTQIRALTLEPTKEEK